MRTLRKYKNQKQVIDNITFDSKREARRYTELKLLERAGKISNLRLQVEYELIPACYERYERYSKKTGNRLKDGMRCVERAISYKADFVYKEDGKTVVEDTKGFKTKDYIIKRKLMRHLFGIEIKEV